MAYANRIRVLVLHSDSIARAGLAVALGSYPDLDIIALKLDVEDRSEVLRASRCASIEVIVSDYALGVGLAEAITHHGAVAGAPKVVILASMDREWEIRSALENGVRGILLLGCSWDALAIGVRAVHHGNRHLSPQIAARLAESVAAERLTPREEEVLRLVVEGLCNKAISRRLGIAVGTVKSHLKATFAKLDVESRTQAVVAVERRGLLRQARMVSPSASESHKPTSLPQQHHAAPSLQRVGVGEATPN
jgi:DNA-binding NarL/FixJ family response regulator